MATPSHRRDEQRRSNERAQVRRLAAQLGISTAVLQHGDDSGGNADDNDHDSDSGDRNEQVRAQQQQQQHILHRHVTATREEHIDHGAGSGNAAAVETRDNQQHHLNQRRNATDAAVASHSNDDSAAELLDADELEESLDQYEFDTTELPDSGVLASDSNSLSASESVSSDLSLPRSFGRYDAVRSAVTAAGGTTGRPPFRGVSQFDDHLMHFVFASPHTQPQQQHNRSAGIKTEVTPSPSPASTDILKRFYAVQVDKVRSQLTLATQTQQQLEQTLQHERTNWNETLARIEREHMDERRVAEQATAAAVNDLQAAKKRLKLEKTHFANLHVSDALAEQLARQDESDLSIREFIQLAVYRKVASLVLDLEAARQAIDDQSQTNAALKASAATAHDELVQVQRVAESQTRRLQHELELAAATREELERHVQSLCAQLAASSSNQEERNATVASYTALQAEVETLRSQTSRQTQTLAALEAQAVDLQNRNDTLEQQNALLRADKQYLQTANTQIEARETTLKQRQQELLQTNKTLQATHTRDVDLHANEQRAMRLAFEQKLESESKRLFDTTTRELERIRNNSNNVIERENRLLADARDDARTHVQLLQTKLELAQRTLDEKVLEATRAESSHVTEIAGLRNDLKMQHFEMNQLQLSLEEQLTNVRAMRLEVEMLEQKVQVHRDEFAKLEATSTARITQLEAALDVERSKLREYERLEVDLDDAVLQTGAILDSNNGDQQLVGNDAAATPKLSDAIATFGAIPTSSKRRFQQSVALAQRVVTSQREALVSQQQLDAATLARRELEHELERLRTQLAHVHQPQSYLIDKLKRTEQELQRSEHTTTQVQQHVQELQHELAFVTDAKVALQRQLQDVLVRRSDLDALKSSVQLLQQRLRVNGQSAYHTQQQQLFDSKTVSTPQKTSFDVQEASPQAARDADPTTSSPSPSPYLKMSLPPPAIASQMTQAPWQSTHTTPLNELAAAHTHNDAVVSSATYKKRSDDPATHTGAREPVLSPSPPRWYTKLRSG